MQVLTTILYILLFIVFLSILIIIHELGHLAAAKAFNVYCLEYSIGMGPALFKYKRKNGETQFTLRGIPFGGYVSMYGEGVELPEGVTIDESRSLNGIKPWKRAIILLAGVTMNALLALVFFFVSNCFPQESIDYINHISVSETITDFKDGDYIRFESFVYRDPVTNSEQVFYLADNQTTFNDDDTVKYATCFNFDSLKSFKELGLENFIYFYELRNDPISLYSQNDVDYSNQTIYISEEVYQAERAFKLLIDNGIITSYSIEKFDKQNLDYEPKTVKIETIASGDFAKSVNEGKAVIMTKSFSSIDWADTYRRFTNDNFVADFSKNVKANFTSATINLTRRIDGPKGGSIDGPAIPISISQIDGKVQPFGLSIFYTRTQYSFGQAIQHAFIDFGESSIALFKAIGGLFTSATAWQNVGGIVAVGFQTTSVLQNLGFGRFLYVWGFVSVNLAIFNLLPFPGLDGWQLLVLIIEVTARKKIPERVKNIVSLVGIGLLLLLMVVVLAKDLWFYVFKGIFGL